MGQKYALQGASFINPAFRKLYDDKGLNDGSLAMLDLTHSLTAYTGVPTDVSTVYNIAWNQAKSIIGSGDAASLAWETRNAFTPTSGLFERTTKGALHGLISQVAKLSTNFYYFKLPLALREYMRTNTTRNYAVWFWYQLTRTSGNTTNLREFIDANTVSVSSNSIFNGSFSNSLTGAPDRATINKATGWTGTAASADGTHTTNYPAWGNASGFTGLNLTGSKSFVLYRVHIVDVALSGKTYAELEADDLALFNSLFGVGGRLHGDSWALTSGSLA